MATKITKRPAVQTIKRVPHERRFFSILALTDPAQLKKIKYDTTYEEIECVGLQPEQNLLEAIIRIKQDAGYSGEICSTGSLEYVRFYADYNDDGNWQDLGYGSVRVHDIPGPKPICYSVKLTIAPPKRYCRVSNVVKVRAILSWNAIPTPNTPNYPPAWGNVIDVNVQTEPSRRIPIGVLVGQHINKISKLSADDKAMFENIDSAAVIEAAPKALTLAERSVRYQEAKVGVDRFAFAELTKLANAPLQAISLADPISEYLKDTKALLNILNGFAEPKGNTTYEEVKCVGLRPEDDSVAAVLTVKKNAGYSGGL